MSPHRRFLLALLVHIASWIFSPFPLYSSCHKCISRNILLLWLTAYNMLDQGKDSFPVRIMKVSSFFPFQHCMLSQKFTSINCPLVAAHDYMICCDLGTSSHRILWNPQYITKMIQTYISVQDFLLFSWHIYWSIFL